MSSLPVEATEPDAAATSIPNDETVNKEQADPSAPTAMDIVAEDKQENGETKAEKKEENGTVEEKKSDKPVERKDENGVLKTSGRILEGRNNSKYDASKLPESDDPTKIRAQVEFYFGDSNLPTDKFLWEKTDGSSNLPVDVDIICKFGRMKRFKSRDVILAALKESKFLQVTGEEGKEQVNRRVAYDPTFTKSSKVEARSIYVKGFGDEEPSSQFDIEAFFAPYGPTNAVRLRRTPDKFFKGSVFVEFQDEETAKKFLELDPKPLWKGTLPLNIMSKKAYVDGKEQDIKDGKLDPQEARTPYQRGGRGRGRGGRGGNFKGGDRERNGNRDRGDRDPDDWKKRREDDRASGFKDDRRNGRDGHHKKGGRGGRGGRRDDRGGRGGDRNREREDRDKDSKAEAKTEESNEKKAEPVAETTPNEKKRAREDDGEGAPAKKIDTKTEVSVES